MKEYKPICFIDIETTGLNTKSDKIIDISLIKTIGKDVIEFNSLINPIIKIPKEAVKIHGINDLKVKNSPTFNEVSKKIFHFIQGCDLAGFGSIKFDIPLLHREMFYAGYVLNFNSTRFIDVGNIFNIKEDRGLLSAYRFYCGKKHKKQHQARADNIVAMEIFEAQMKKYPDLKRMSIDKLAVFCNYGMQKVDIDGCFALNSKGVVVINIGQNKGMKAAGNFRFLQWVINGEFSTETKEVANRILYGDRKKKK